MIKKVRWIVAALLVSLLVGGCATIAGGGSTQELTIDSNPKGAKIFLGNLVKGEVINLSDSGLVTPSKVTVSRKDAVIILKEEGYEDTNIILTKRINGWVFGNIIFGGVIGISIDSSTGAANRYDPNELFIELQATDTSVK